MAICNSEHRFLSKFDTLPEDQSHPNRHHCAGCAYELGLECGKERRLPPEDISFLPTSQAGAVRHKSAKHALVMGYLEGMRHRVALRKRRNKDIQAQAN